MRSSCAACTIGCEQIYSLNDKQHSGVRLEYENLFAFGPLCGIDDPQTVLAASQACDELGLDTISMGGTVAFAMECVQRGWLDAPQLTFGNGAGLLDAIRTTAARAGLGDQLAEGSLRFAQRIGPHAIPYAAQIKGLELPGYDPRKLPAMAVGLAVCARGADHNRSGAYEADYAAQPDADRSPAKIAQSARGTEDRAAVMDSLILCKFIRGCLDDFWGDCSHYLELVTGLGWTPAELQAAASRIIDLKRHFNELAGWTPAADRLPDRFFSDSAADPPGPLTRHVFQAHLNAYYGERGWTARGYLTEARRAAVKKLTDAAADSLTGGGTPHGTGRESVICFLHRLTPKHERVGSASKIGIGNFSEDVRDTRIRVDKFSTTSGCWPATFELSPGSRSRS